MSDPKQPQREAKPADATPKPKNSRRAIVTKPIPRLTFQSKVKAVLGSP